MDYNYLIKHIPVLQLQFSTKNLLCKLLTLKNENNSNDLVLTYKDMAELTNSSVKTIQRIIKQLKDHKMISSIIIMNKPPKCGRGACSITVNNAVIAKAIEERQRYLSIELVS